MKNVGKWVLGAAVLAGGLGLGATTAQAAQWRVVVGTNEAYVPPCPGPGYVWVAGYYDGGYWVPGYWNYVGGVYRSYDRDDFAYRHFDRDDYRHVDRDHDRAYYRNQDRRSYDRDDHRDRDHDRFRR